MAGFGRSAILRWLTALWFALFPIFRERIFDFLAGRGVFLARAGDEFRADARSFRTVHWRRQRYANIEIEICPLHPADGFANVEVLKIPRFKEGKPVRELPGVFIANAEADPRIWMREHEAELILAHAGENLRHRRCREVMKLIEVKVERAAFALFHFLAADGELMKLGDQQRAEKKCVFLPDE